MLALIGFALMIILMFVLIKEKMAPPLAFILLPLIAAVLAGFGLEEIAGFIKTGMNTMLSTAILFIFSISYFTMMSDAGLFDPIINFLIKRAGKNVATIFIAIVLTTFVAHLDGSGATTFLIVVPAFLPICKRMGVRPQALLAAMCRCLRCYEPGAVGRSDHACRKCGRCRGRRPVWIYDSGCCMSGNCSVLYCDCSFHD